MNVAQSAIISRVDKFLEFIYGPETGYAYIATKVPDSNSNLQSVTSGVWHQEFFHWPQQKAEITAYIQEKTNTHEVYYAPALFKEANGKKQSVKSSRVFWCEFDGEIPQELGNFPAPSIRVQSSIEGHEHWYWIADEAINPYDLERVNRSISYHFGADLSGWDANQVLRPIGTRNHKRNATVTLIQTNPGTVNPGSFSELPDPPPTVEAPVPENIPPVEDVLFKYPFPERVIKLFRYGPKDGDRSDGLMALGYYLAEMQLSGEETFSLLLNADERWGKFKGRSDQTIRLAEIVVRAKAKYPYQQQVENEKPLESVGFKSVLALEYSLEWIWEGALQEGGYMLLTGPSGVGKTQFALDACAHFALGREYLGRAVNRKMKIGFFSLEMGPTDLKYFLAQQAAEYSEEELEVLEQNLRFFPLGEPIYLATQNETDRINQVIEKEELDGIVIDSMGSVTEETLSDEKTAKILMDWNDRIRQRYGVFTWFIHHHRKATSDNKKPNKLSDIYGSYLYTARVTTAVCLWGTGDTNTVQVNWLKVRLAAPPDAFFVYRNPNLRFILKKTSIQANTDYRNDSIGPSPSAGAGSGI